MGNVSLNMDSTNAESLNGKHDFDFFNNIEGDIKPDNSGASSLIEYINSVPLSTFSFCASTFADLPTDDNWGYNVTVNKLGGMIYVIAYRGLSDKIIYLRSCGIDGEWNGSWTRINDGGNADTLDGRHALDFPTIVEVPDGTSANTCVGERSGGTTIYRCCGVSDSSSTNGFTDVPTDTSKMSTSQGLIIAYNFAGAGTTCVNQMWVYQKFISPHYGLTFHRYIDNLSIGDWVKDDEYIGENLLDNPDFKINQRGLTEYTSAGYSYDRWFLGRSTGPVNASDGVCTITVGSLTDPQHIIQKVQGNFAGKTLTLSLNVNEVSNTKLCARITNTSYSDFANITDISSAGFYHTTVTIPSDYSSKYITVLIGTYTGQVDGHASFSSVKLEVGSNVTPFVAPNPAEELLKIQSMNDDGTPKLISNDALPTIMNSQMVSNPNLLINPDFKINQRGLTEYTVASGTTYTVDRWAIQYNAKATTNVDGGIHLDYTGKNNSGFYQVIDNNLSGKTVTFSFKASGSAKIIFGVWETSTSAITLTDTPTIYTKTFQSSDDTSFGLWLGEYIEGAYMDIEWAKVEISPIATPFCPPDPATELAKCQRYFYRMKSSTNQCPIFFIARVAPANRHFSNSQIRLPVPMRRAPTVTLSGTLDVHLGTSDAQRLTYGSLAAIHVSPLNDIIDINIYTTEMASSEFVTQELLAGSYIDFNAEL